MARFIINNMVYDTQNMKYISKVEKVYACESILLKHIYGENVGMRYDCDLYRSSKGNYLLVHREGGSVVGEAITEAEAKKLLMRFDYEAYKRLYGELEEA